MTLSAVFVAELREAVGPEHVVTEPEQLRVYECDGLTGHRAVPEVVVLPRSTEEVQAVVRACHREQVPFVARGAGTGLSGGATPTAGGVVVSLARMDRILEVDLESQRVVVEPGVANLDVTRAVAAEGFFYAPDPSSQQVCTIGGNVAENSGGAHCLKHGFTVHHVTGLTLVLPDGEVVELGGKALDPDGPDLLGAVVGSEGTLGIVTASRCGSSAARRTCARSSRASRRRTRRARRYPGSSPRGSSLGARDDGPADDRGGRARRLARLPRGRGAVLLVELDGVAAQVEEDAAEVERICLACGAFELHAASDDAARALLWKGRKSAFAAMGRVATDYYVQDGVVPRTRLPEVLRRIEELSQATACASATSSTPGTATSTRSSSTTRRPARRSARASSRRRSSRPASTRAGRSRASTASAWTRRARCRACSPSATCGVRAGPGRVRPARDLQPGQGDPDAAPLRRGAGAVPRPRTREDRRCRASLASRRRPSGSRARTRPGGASASATT